MVVTNQESQFPKSLPLVTTPETATTVVIGLWATIQTELAELAIDGTSWCKTDSIKFIKKNLKLALSDMLSPSTRAGTFQQNEASILKDVAKAPSCWMGKWWW